MPESMSWTNVASALFFFGWSCIGLFVASTLRDIGQSVKELNINVAVVIEKVSNHEKRIERLEGRDD